MNQGSGGGSRGGQQHTPVMRDDCDGYGHRPGACEVCRPLLLPKSMGILSGVRPAGDRQLSGVSSSMHRRTLRECSTCVWERRARARETGMCG